jgi:hypothetical protein
VNLWHFFLLLSSYGILTVFIVFLLVFATVYPVQNQKAVTEGGVWVVSNIVSIDLDPILHG